MEGKLALGVTTSGIRVSVTAWGLSVTVLQHWHPKHRPSPLLAHANEGDMTHMPDLTVGACVAGASCAAPLHESLITEAMIT